MRRVALGVLLALAAAAAARPARADCTDEIRVIRTRLPEVKEDPRREELRRLVEKAEKDEGAGRAKLCDQDVRHAQALLK